MMMTTSTARGARRVHAGPAPALCGAPGSVAGDHKSLAPQLLTVLGCAKIVGEQVFEDMRFAGWITPRVVKENARRPRPFFAVSDLRACEARMLRGEYPMAPNGAVGRGKEGAA